jgi:hypothetical protein
MGEFALNIAAAYQIGAARGVYSILSAMDIREDELFAAFGQTIHGLILRHRKDLEITRSVALKIDPRWLAAASTTAGAKTRCGWNAGIFFHICGLRLFPDAFIHLVRDVRAVVHSMLTSIG